MQKIIFLIITFLIFFSNAVFGQHVKKDGTPDRRYKENKSYSPPPSNSSSTTHLKKDGTPDRRYKGNKSYSAPSNYSSSTTARLKKDGTPDRRYKVNRTYFSTPSTSTSPSFKYYTSTKKNKTIYYYSVKRDAKGKIHRSQSATYAFKRMTGYPHGRSGYVIDHIVALKRGGCDCPSNMQWQTISDAKAKDRVEVP